MSTFDLVAAGLYMIPALVWAIIARHAWWYGRRTGQPSRAFRLAPLAAGAVTLHALLHAVRVLVPSAALETPVGAIALLVVAFETSGLAMLAVGRHLFRLLPIPEERPGAAWLAVNYGPTAAAAAVFAAAQLLPGETAADLSVASAVLHGWGLVLVVLIVREAIRVARPGVFGPEAAGEIRRPDLVIMAWGFTGSALASLAAGVLAGRTLGFVVFEVGCGLALAAPWALRMLGHIVPDLLGTFAVLAATAVVFGVHGYTQSLLDPRFRPLLAFAAIATLGLVVSPGQAWLRTAVTRLLFRRSLSQHAKLQAFLHTLSPEVGAVECCRRALTELVRVRRLRGAAIILRDGQAIVHGSFTLEPVLRVWPRGGAADALPARSFGSAELRTLPLALREALIEANVGLGAAPIISPRQRWGHLFMNTGFLGGTFREDDHEVFQSFVDQLARVLDAADLLARAVAVERSLAHAEKLAAIGEFAARIAHEIRNPVTAARSLAQQLAGEPGSPFAAEHAVILGELERVERHVAALLRFARREELHLERVDLGALARETLEAFRSRLDGAGIALELRAADGIVAHADREKLRQVLVNLIENAVDALTDGAAARRLVVAVARADGRGALEVSDSGAGVPPEALPHLFEPFFTQKAHGTGLGLAIARRTVEAHGGTIEASCSGTGLSVRVQLPLAAAT